MQMLPYRTWGINEWWGSSSSFDEDDGVNCYKTISESVTLPLCLTFSCKVVYKLFTDLNWQITQFGTVCWWHKQLPLFLLASLSLFAFEIRCEIEIPIVQKKGKFWTLYDTIRCDAIWYNTKSYKSVLLCLNFLQDICLIWFICTKWYSQVVWKDL